MKVKSKNKTIASSPSMSIPRKDYLKNPVHPYAFQHLHNAFVTSVSHGDAMPFVAKKRKSAADEEEDETPTTKRGKGATGNVFQPSSRPQTDSDGNKYWEIAKSRRVTISEYKGKTMVSIREYYEKDNQTLPGKKGISMSVEQYSAFIQIMPQVEELLKSENVSVPRPDYSGSAPAQDDDDDEDEEVDAKANIDATSDEDE